MRLARDQNEWCDRGGLNPAVGAIGLNDDDRVVVYYLSKYNFTILILSNM